MRLRQAAVKGLGAKPARAERLRQRVDFRTRPAEHDGGGGVLDVEDAAERRHLVSARHDIAT
jgi:hypothetical protein